jgi:YegS/Rv2252/BmrU family lipid kinase
MDSKKLIYDYIQSEGFGSVERLAKLLANNGYRTIVVVGGDGALNDAINGIMNSNAENKKDIAIGMIPNGIGNDFAKYWGISIDDYKKAIDWIINNRRKKIDIGYCSYYTEKKHEQRYFLNAVNIGLGARIVQINDQTKRFWGIKHISFLAAALLLLFFERKLYRMRLTVNNERIQGNIMTVCIGNANGYGQTPSAVPYNGWLDVSVIYRPDLLEIFSGLWMLVQGRILNHKVVKSYRTKKVKLYSARNADISLDGRLLPKHYPIEVSIWSEAITIIIPD